MRRSEMITNSSKPTIPARELCDLIMAAAPTPDSPVVVVKGDMWGLGVRSLSAIRLADDGTIEMEIA